MHSTKFAVTSTKRYIDSVENARQFVTANKLVNLFRNMYGDIPELVGLQCDLQLKRLDLKLNRARRINR